MQQYGEGPKKSLFFTKLNRDIRQFIYRELLVSPITYIYVFYERRIHGVECRRMECMYGGKIHTNILLTCKAAFNEGAYLFYQLNTFYFNTLSDAVDFFAYIPAAIVRHIRSYEFECLFTGGEQKPIPDFDVLISTLDRYLVRDNVKVELVILLPHFSFYHYMYFTQACKENTIEALWRFLALPKLSAALVILPRGFEEEVQKMLETSGGYHVIGFTYAVGAFFTVLLPTLKHISNPMNGILQPVLRSVWSCEGLGHDAISDQVLLIQRPQVQIKYWGVIS
ncbi:hypothetical protein J7337_009820 [Fusarium musae]|uniref:Uncharacterized protein n=1 Tax=Fusarium musae TaxID=1042133 RepID=A0A9P8IML6_9HYPO|nr:hypothetical protein J7337_009820 [Fusarium musae]KAG9499009.1 hypothetical protein J7337_009820 [Fusarium musae]